MTNLQKLMKDRNVSIRDLSKVTGTNISLTCYISRGIAHYPTYLELEKCCQFLQCKPEEVFPVIELKFYYREKYIQTKKVRHGNPSVRVREDLVAQIKERHNDVASFVNAAIEEYFKKED